MRTTPAILAVVLSACPPSEQQPPPLLPDLPAGGCGLAGHAWVPLDEVGGIVFAEPADDLSMGAAGLDMLLESYEITQFSPLPFDVSAWRVRYVTQDRGSLAEATMVLAMPQAEGAEVPLVVFPHGTSGFTDECAPSAGGIEESAIPVVLAAMGFAVAAPDYLGMNGVGAPAGFLHPYLVPEATAIATLDAARATLRLQETEDLGSRADAGRVALWGGSEGGFAALWAERYAGEYLPEVEVTATLALVPPTDLTAIAYRGLAEPIEATVGLAAAWIGQHSWYGGGDLAEVLLAPLAEALPAEMMASCGDFPSMDGVDTIEEIFQPSVVATAAAGELESLDPWGCYLAMADLADTAIAREVDPPVLVVISGADELVVADTVRDSIPVLCDQGYDIEHLECAGADHAEGAGLSLPYQIEWLQDRLDGVPLAGACVINEPIDCEQFIEQG